MDLHLPGRVKSAYQFCLTTTPVALCVFAQGGILSTCYQSSVSFHCGRVSLAAPLVHLFLLTALDRYKSVTLRCGAGKEASAGAGPVTDERGQLHSSPQLQQQRAVLASLAVDPGMHTSLCSIATSTSFHSSSHVGRALVNFAKLT